MTIPIWQEAKDRNNSNKCTPLDRFVADYEPLMPAEANEWRADLAALLSYTLAKAPYEQEVFNDDQGQVAIEFTD